MVDVENLQSSTDGKNGQIASKRLADEIEFHLVAGVVGAIGFGKRCLLIESRVHIGAAHQKQAGSSIQANRPCDVARNRLETRSLNRSDIRIKLMGMAVRDQNTLGHRIYRCSASLN